MLDRSITFCLIQDCACLKFMEGVTPSTINVFAFLFSIDSSILRHGMQIARVAAAVIAKFSIGIIEEYKMEYRSQYKAILLAVLLACGLMKPAATEAATYYVSTSGSDSNSGSQSSPFRTISRGIQATASGDTLLVAAGTYVGSFSPRSNTTIRSNGSVVLQGSDSSAIFNLSGVTNVVVDGFVLDGSNSVPGGAFYFNSASGNTIQNSEIMRFRNQGILVQPGSNSNQFINLDIHHVGVGNCYDNRGGYCHGMYVSGDSNIVDGCRLHDNDGHGIQVYSAPENNSGTPDGNTVRNTEAWGQQVGIGVYWGQANRVEGNRSRNNQTGIRNNGGGTILASNVACENSGSNFNDLVSGTVLSGNLFGNPCPASTPSPAPTPSNLRIVSTQP